MNRRAFTTVELLIVLAIFVLSAATTLPFLGSFREVETVGTIGEDVLQTLRRAQHRAVTGERGSAWGVKLLPRAYVLYAGDTYAERTVALDSVHAVPETYLFSGSQEFTFQRITGAPLSPGTMMLSHPEGGEKRIEVNAVGRIFLE